MDNTKEGSVSAERPGDAVPPFAQREVAWAAKKAEHARIQSDVESVRQFGEIQDSKDLPPSVRVLREIETQRPHEESELYEPEEEKLSSTLHNLSSRIDRVWEEVVGEEEITDPFNVERYRRIAEKMPRLSAKAQALASQLVRSEDPKDQEEGMKILFHTNLRTVLGVVDRFSQLGPQKEELLERGILATIGTIKGYHPSSVRLNQRIHQSVTSASQEALADYFDVPSSWVYERYLETIPVWMGEFHHQHGRLPTAEEIAQNFHVPKKEVEYQLKEGLLTIVQLPSQVKTRVEEEEVFGPVEISAAIEEVLSTLQSREEKVVRMSYGLPPYQGPYTHEEIAKEFGVTSSRINQIEKKALRRLRYYDRYRKLRGLQ